MRKMLARWIERIGLKWAIVQATFSGKYKPISHAEAVELWRTTPRNSFYDAHTPGKKNIRSTDNV